MPNSLKLDLAESYKYNYSKIDLRSFICSIFKAESCGVLYVLKLDLAVGYMSNSFKLDLAGG